MKSSDEIRDQFPRVIAFFGPDGAGKSTQAQLVVNILKSNGLKVKKAWVRSVHSFAFLLWKLLVRLKLCRFQRNIPIRMPTRSAISHLGEERYGAVSPISYRPPILNGSISRLLWSIIEVVSILPIILLQIYIPLFLGYVVVAERYVVDSIATVAYFIDDRGFAKSRLAKFLLKFIPKRTVFIFVDANYQTIVTRRGNAVGPPEYTEFHREIYNELAPQVGAMYINTSKLSVEETFARIVNFISGSENCKYRH